MTCATQKQRACTKNKRLITDKKEGTVERPLLRIPMHVTTRTATSGVSFHVFKNDKNAIVHSLRGKGITAYEKSNPDCYPGLGSSGCRISEVAPDIPSRCQGQ